MSLIICGNCGKKISNKAKMCPNCGISLVEEPAPAFCEECGSRIPHGAESCPQCGCPAPTAEVFEKKARKTELKKNKIKKETTIKLVAIAAMITLASVAILYSKNNILIGDNKIAYELLAEVADNFKDPASVQLVSGTLGVDKDCLFARISAKNGFGARNSVNYFISDGYAIEERDDVDIGPLCRNDDGLNYELINKKLRKQFG